MDGYSQERIGLFVDGANLYAAARALGVDLDYKRLLDEFASRGRLIRAFYYTAMIEDHGGVVQRARHPCRPLPKALNIVLSSSRQLELVRHWKSFAAGYLAVNLKLGN